MSLNPIAILPMSCYLWLSSELTSTLSSSALAHARISGPISCNREAKLSSFYLNLNGTIYIWLWLYMRQSGTFWGYLLDLKHKGKCSTPFYGQLSLNLSEISIESSFPLHSFHTSCLNIWHCGNEVVGSKEHCFWTFCIIVEVV